MNAHRHRPRWTAWIGALGLLAACVVAPRAEREMADGYATTADGTALDGLGAPDRPVAGLEVAALDDLTGEVSTSSRGAADRMMVRTAELHLEIARIDEAVARCQDLVAEHGGYVSRRDGSTLTCRVPAVSFDPFVDAIRMLGRVVHESMQALDVTDQHRDLSIRLDNAKKSRERLLALLEKAERVEDLIKIEAELRRLTEEIEQMTAELQELEGRVALSTVTVRFRAAEPPDRPIGRRRPSRFWWINSVGAENVLRGF